MGFNIEALKLLQGIDKEIYDLKEEQKMIPLQIKDNDDKFDLQKESVRNAEEEVKEVKLLLHKQELALKEKEDQIKKYNGQLSQVKTNKEYTALQSEINSIKADNSILEEEILQILDRVQIAEKDVQKELAVLGEIEKEREMKKKELDALLQKNTEVIDDLNSQREQIIKDINAEDLRVYEKILKAKEGLALSQIINNACSVCSMNLLSQTISEVMMGDKIVFCESCHRILYIQKEPAL
jgi:uncharacterized protein